MAYKIPGHILSKRIGKVVVGTLNLRDKPDGKDIGDLHKGDLLEIISSGHMTGSVEWLWVNVYIGDYMDKQGYVARTVKLTPNARERVLAVMEEPQTQPKPMPIPVSRPSKNESAWVFWIGIMIIGGIAIFTFSYFH